MLRIIDKMLRIIDKLLVELLLLCNIENKKLKNLKIMEKKDEKKVVKQEFDEKDLELINGGVSKRPYLQFEKKLRCNQVCYSLL